MYSAWYGGSNSALASNVNGTANFHGLTGGYSGGWNTTNANRQCPVSEAITVVGLYVICDTDPTPGNLTFALDVAGSASAVTCTVAAGQTTASFTGSVAVAQDALLSLRCTPAASAAVQTSIHWVLEYKTSGNFFCMIGGSSTTFDATVTNFADPVGFYGSAHGTAATQRMILYPAIGTLTRLSVATPAGAPGAGKSYAFSLRTNDTTDNLTATISGNSATAAQATGSIAITAGMSAVIKGVPSGTPTLRRAGWCVSVTPAQPDQSWWGMGGDADTTTGPKHEQMTGVGSNGWSSTENTRNLRIRPYYLSNLYAAVQTAPGGSTARIFTVRDNAASTALTCTITGAATTANDTLDRVLMTGTSVLFGMQQSMTGTPAATAGYRLGWTFEVVPQIYAPPQQRAGRRPFGALAAQLCDM